MGVRHRIRRVIQGFGLDVRPFPRDDPAFRRARLLAHHRVEHVLDVGASDGRFAGELRRFGFEGRITSFEPLQTAFAQLQRRAAKDPLWQALPYAIGDGSGEVTLNVAANDGASSSIQPMLEAHLEAAPSAAYAGTETVAQKRLDDLADVLGLTGERVFLKIDVQGYERHVLGGADAVLSHCVGVQLELSFVPLYEGAMGYREAIDFMTERGLALELIQPGFTNAKTGQTLQADAAFFRKRP